MYCASGKLLYKTAFQTNVPSLIYESVKPLAPSCLIIGDSFLCPFDGPFEYDDPRNIFHYDADNLDHYPKTIPATGFEADSPELYVIFDTKEASARGLRGLFHRNVPEGDDGLQHAEIRICLQVVSSAWFDRVHGPARSSTSRHDNYQFGTPAATETRAYDRHGYKSAVPVPLTADGNFYDISLAPVFVPEWATTGNPEEKRYENVEIGENSWRFTYSTELEEFEDDGDEDLAMMFAMAQEELEEMNEENGFVSTSSRVNVELVKVPLIDLLRPPVSGEDPYYESY